MNLEQLKERVNNWSDSTLKGLSERALLMAKIYEIERQEYLFEKTGKKLGLDIVDYNIRNL